MGDTNILRILCVRHGKTNYTGVYPDLTVEGTKHIQDTTNESVQKWIAAHRIGLNKLGVMSSPAPRARGTAGVITSAINPLLPITNCIGIDAMKWRDHERCLAACRGFAGKGYINYETESVFADPELFETPAEIRARWYAFLAWYIRAAMNKELPRMVIFVSHYEVLSNITRDLFEVVPSEETALRHGETIALSVYPSSNKKHVYLSGAFRNQEADAIFDLSTHNIDRV